MENRRLFFKVLKYKQGFILLKILIYKKKDSLKSYPKIRSYYQEWNV